MIERLQITTLVENTAGGRGLLAEHGLAFWIEIGSQNILFDTGQGMALAHNAEVLGVDLGTTDAVVLSHGHYDHAGGVDSVLKCASQVNLYAHPAAFENKFVRGREGTAYAAGAPGLSEEEVSARAAKLELTRGPTEIAEGVWVTGEIPRRTRFEDTGGPFYCDEACTTADRLPDDQALYIESKPGLVVLLGCAHSGLVNTLDYVNELTGQDRIRAVLGGMHLVGASDERLARSEEALQRYHVQCIGPAHCTGRAAATRLWKRFPDRCVECTAGTRFVFE